MATCHDRGLDAIRNAIEGKKTELDAGYRGCMSDISSPPAGSQNWPVQLRGAAVINGFFDADMMLPFLRGENRWGHNGRETGSGIYEAWNVATVIALLHWAKRQDKEEIVEAARGWLRAEWVKLALAATEMPQDVRVEAADRQGKLHAEKREPAVGGYKGLLVHLAGNRMYTDLDENTPQGYPVERSFLGPLLSWAVDWSPRGRPHIDRAHQGGGWTLWLIETLSGKPYRTTAPPGIFGLTKSLREALHAYIDNPTRVDAKPLLAHLDPYKMRGKVSMTYLCLENGGVATVLSRIENGNKPGIPIVCCDGKLSSWAGPSLYKGEGAPQATGSIDGDDLVAEEGGRTVRLTLPAAVRYRIVHDRQGVRLDGEPLEHEVPDHGDPVKDESFETPLSSPRNRAIERAEQIPALADQQHPTSQEGKRAVRKIKNRAREIPKKIRLGSAASIRSAIQYAEEIPGFADRLRPVSRPAIDALQQIRNRAARIEHLLSRA